MERGGRGGCFETTMMTINLWSFYYSDEEDQFVSDAYGVKMRGQQSRSSSPKLGVTSTNDEDDLKWVEENIPAALADAALPIIDSDEEILNTKFEVSKMQ